VFGGGVFAAVVPMLRHFHVLLMGRTREWYWDHVRHCRVDRWSQLRTSVMDGFEVAKPSTSGCKNNCSGSNIL